VRHAWPSNEFTLYNMSLVCTQQKSDKGQVRGSNAREYVLFVTGDGKVVLAPQ